MKILFVDETSGLPEKWIEPLRSEGWGIVRVRSTEDAEKVFEFHGDSLNALVVSEAHAAWAEKWNYPYIVLLKTWKDFQVMKHQNSASRAASAYLDYDSPLELMKQAIMTANDHSHHQSFQSTGTTGPEVSRIVEVPSTGEEEVQKTVMFDTSNAPQEQVQNHDQDRTVIIEATSIAGVPLSAGIEAFLNEKSEFIDQIEIVEESRESLPESIQTVSEETMESVGVENNAPETHFNFAENKDLETMKNYLALREQDVALLTGQVRSSQERVQQLEMQLKMERARSAELQHVVQKQEQQILNFDRDKQVELEVIYRQVEDLNLQLRERTDKARAIEARLKITTDEVEKVKDRVRVDIRRIRVREKELESQLEILKKDSTALLVARDEKIVELKRKVDLLEFNMELVQEQYGKERHHTEQLRHKLKEAAGVMKRAGGLLDHEN